MLWLPAQTPGLAEVAGVGAADLEQAAWALTPDGRWLRGPQGILAAGDAVVAGGRGLLVAAGGLPLIRLLAEGIYGVVARHRRRLPGTLDAPAARQRPPLAPEVAREIRRRLALSPGGVAEEAGR